MSGHDMQNSLRELCTYCRNSAVSAYDFFLRMDFKRINVGPCKADDGRVRKITLMQSPGWPFTHDSRFVLK